MNLIPESIEWENLFEFVENDLNGSALLVDRVITPTPSKLVGNLRGGILYLVFGYSTSDADFSGIDDLSLITASFE